MRTTTTPVELKVLMNHIYELHKGVRHMVLFTCNNKYGEQVLSLSRESGKLWFTTIRKFKGLEAEAILIVDATLSSLAQPESRRLLYVGSSRAKNLLYIALLDDVDSSEMDDLMKSIAPGRSVPKNKKGLKRLLNVTM